MEAMDAAGNFVGIWSSSGRDVANTNGGYMREYSWAGAALRGEVLVNTVVSGDQQNASVALSPGGEVIVVWSGNGPGDNEGVVGQRFFE